MSPPDVSTERLSVRPWSADDAAWYVAAIDDEIRRFTREPLHLTAETWMAHQVPEQPDRMASSVAVVERGQGLVGKLGVEMHPESVELSYWIAAPFRGRGVATELLRAATEWAALSGAPVIELRIHPENTASIGVAQRVGYRFLGFEDSCESCADDQGRVAVYRFAA